MKKKYIVLVGFIFMISLFSIIFSTIDKNNNEPIVSQITCSHSYISSLRLNSFDREEFDSKVIDFYIDDTFLSNYYFDKLCDYLIVYRINDTLSKSDNFYYETRSINNPANDGLDYGLNCEYRIQWNSPYEHSYENTAMIDSGEEFFNASNLALAIENHLPKFNKTDIKIDYYNWSDNYETSRIINNNPDFDVLLQVRFDKEIKVCN